MKSVLDFVLGIVALAALVYGVIEFYQFIKSPGAEGDKTHLWWAIGCAVVLCVCALALFLRHSGSEEEIHITQ